METKKSTLQKAGKIYPKNWNALLFLSGTLFLLLIVGCVSSSPPASPEPVPVVAVACTTKDCFIFSANACTEQTMTLTEDAGVITYASSKDCIFSKTLVSLNVAETQEMKNLLQGKSLTCRYEETKFDGRWVNSLIYGTEYCEGELKDLLAQLISFT